MEEENYLRQSEKYIEFQDTKKGDCKYEINIEPSKSCVIICIICLFCTIIIAVGIALALVLPKKKIIPPSTTELPTTEDVFKTEPTTTPEAYEEISESELPMEVITYATDKTVVTDDIGFVITEPPDDDDQTFTPGPELIAEAMKNQKKKTSAAPGGDRGTDGPRKPDAVENNKERAEVTTTENPDDMPGGNPYENQYGNPRTTTTFSPSTSKQHRLKYRIGVGIADMTGPFVELPFMGYIVNYLKKGKGLHTRQFARAFCFKENKKTIIYVVAETYAVSHNIRVRVLQALQNVSSKNLGVDLSINNVHIAATGTENAPGCHMIDYLWGYGPLFGEECVRPMIEGMRKSIVRACSTAVPARMFYNKADFYYTQKNTISGVFKRNIESEFYATDFDYVLTQLRIENKFGNIIGILNWVSVRAASFTTENRLATSDNLGYAALALERKLNPGKLAGQSKVITAFAVSSVVGITPHIDGGKCVKSNKICIRHMPCEGYYWWSIFAVYLYLGPCHVKLNANQESQHAASIGVRLLTGAQDALDTKGEELRGPLNAMYKPLVKDDNMILKHYNGFNNSFENGEFKLCEPFMGDNFRVVPYDQNDLFYHNERPDWRALSDKFLFKMKYPTNEIRKCHSPRILYASGYSKPNKYHAHLHPPDVTISIINLGGFLVACIPAETSVMVGRRIVRVITKVMESKDLKPRVVVSGSTNEYVYMITTYEENTKDPYYHQSFTTFGPRTADAVLNKLDALAKIVTDETTSIYFELKGLGPEVERPVRIKNVHSSVPLNMPPRGTFFAEILEQPSAFVRKGGTLRAKFIASNPRVNLRHETSFFVIEKRCNKQWIISLRDSEWDTRFHWDNMTGLIEWKVSQFAQEGLYRIRYFAYANKKEFLAITKNFNIS